MFVAFKSFLSQLLLLLQLIHLSTTQTVVIDNESQIPTFKVCYTDYVGFTPLKFAYFNDIIKKHADPFGIAIELVKVPHYVDQVVRFSTGEFAACTMTIEGVASVPMVEAFLAEIQALMFPDATIDKDTLNTTVLVVAGYSAGNDMIISHGDYQSIADLKGQRVLVEEGTAQEYMLARALDLNGMSLDDVVLAPSALDSIWEFEIGEVAAMVARCPLCEEGLKVAGARDLFNSSQIPGELLDLIAVNTAILNKYPSLGLALAGAWYESMHLLKEQQFRETVMTNMANISGFQESFFTEFERTRFLYTPNQATQFIKSKEIKDITSTVLGYLFTAGIFDNVYTNVDEKGVQFPNGVVGDEENVRIFFESMYTEALNETYL